MAMSIEELAKVNDMPTWRAAEAMARLIKKGLVAPPNGVTPDAQIAHLETAYPRPDETTNTAD